MTLASSSRWLAAVLVLALAVGACDRGSSDLEGDLADAVNATLSEPFAYRISVEADRDALDALGEDAIAAAAFLSGFSLAGSVGDGGTGQFRVVLFGRDLLDVRRPARELTYVRLGLDDVPQLPDALTDPSRLLAALTQLGLGESVEVAMATLLDGRWLAIRGPLGLTPLREATIDADDPPPLATALGADVQERVRRFVDVTDHTESDGQRTFRVAVQLRDLIRALQGADGEGRDLSGVPQRLPGSVFVEDGVITRVRLDIGALTDQADQPGTVEVQLDVTDHGSARPPTEPDAHARVRADELLDAIVTVLRFVAGIGETS